jgi:hypothetical protein
VIFLQELQALENSIMLHDILRRCGGSSKKW